LKTVTPGACCLEYLVDLARADVSFLSGLKNRCFVIEHFPDSSRYSLFELSRRQTPAPARWWRTWAAKDTPNFRRAQPVGDVMAVPLLVGLHHHYVRV
jgi:hypothetical protein